MSSLKSVLGRVARRATPLVSKRWSAERGEAARRLAESERQVSRLRRRLIAAETGARGVRPERMIWIFGVARTGSSWLASMMGDLDGHAVWYEPYVGDVFGFSYNVRSPEWQRQRDDFILSDRYREAWLRSIRSFVMEGADARFPDLGEDGYLVLKEPNGSIGAPLLLESMPESREILLVRDPRDVVASILDANKKGGWVANQNSAAGSDDSLADTDPDTFVRQRAGMYMASMGKAREAHDAHEGPKVVVRYEDLRRNTFNEMKRMYAALGIPVDEARLARAVENHAWEKIPDKNKGAGKFHRKGVAGGWREDLTPEQARIVEEITTPLLHEFYPD